MHAPSVDHEKQDPTADEIEISSGSRIDIIEGNYAPSNEQRCCNIAEQFDERHVKRRRFERSRTSILRWFGDTPSDVARERLIAQHLRVRIEPTRDLAARRVEDNDLPNADLVRNTLFKPNPRIVCERTQNSCPI